MLEYYFRVRYTEPILSSIIHYFENCRGAKHLEKVCLEFIVHEQGRSPSMSSYYKAELAVR
jgi:hypothetical protein